MILIDLQKVFDTLDHDILLGKMKYLGFTSKTIDWFWFLLKKRNTVVNLEKTFFETGISNCGFSQGSILGPMLFLLYVDGMKTTLKNCDLRLYANDTYIRYSHQKCKFIEINLNSDFKTFCKWFVNNKLSTHFGEDKTKSIFFKRRNKSNLPFGITRDVNVTKQYSVVEYLGCLLDENMKICQGRLWLRWF